MCLTITNRFWYIELHGYTSIAEKQTQIFVPTLTMTLQLTAFTITWKRNVQVIRAENVDIPGRESCIECKNIILL